MMEVRKGNPENIMVQGYLLPNQDAVTGSIYV